MTSKGDIDPFTYRNPGRPLKAERSGGGRRNSQASHDYKVWTQIASTNSPERVNREIKRCTDVVGIFPNDDAIIRLIGAITLETNDEWTVAR